MKLDCGQLITPGALTDPEQADGEREKADDQKQFAHGVLRSRRPRGYRATAPEWRGRWPTARARKAPPRLSHVITRQGTKKPRTMPGLLSC